MSTEVLAHITGTVWKIEVAEGNRVEAEQSLVVIESMKMEMPVLAPHAGTVTRVHVGEGQAVDEGDVLLTLSA